MKKGYLIFILTIALLSLSVASAGWFDFGLDNGPIAGDLQDSSFKWETGTDIEGGEGSEGGLKKITLDENGDPVDVNFTSVNNFNCTLKIKLTNVTDSQLERLNELQWAEMNIELDDNGTFNDYKNYDVEPASIEIDGDILKIDIEKTNIKPTIVDGEGELKIKSGNITFYEQDPPIIILF